jgi:hypothetical protein
LGIAVTTRLIAGCCRTFTQCFADQPEDDWYGADFTPPGAGAYRVSVGGDNVEDAEDAFPVVQAENWMS